ncbi:MAG: sigma-70 family RNA polymerase sigma factor, partial [Bacteroidota bacterium]
LQSFNSQFKFFSWIYRIATNESLNFVKSRKQLDSLSDDLESNEKSPDESVHESELQETVQKALMGLTVDQRIVVVLCHFQNLSYREIGFILDLPEKTVKSRLFSARKSLRGLLQKERHP